ncbi:MAG: hypothetical protein KC609_03420 [Myxococcales bacterium]|nr:hypothetical protein [Myxococcales bacterium]
MSWVIFVVAGALVLLGIASISGRRLANAQRNGTIEELVAALDSTNESGRVNAYNRTIQSLWEGYDRERALQLIRAFTERFPKEKIAQYWIDKALTVEPSISAQCLDDAFIVKYYEPHVAQQCGTYG